MALKLEDKKALVAEVNEVAKRALSAVVTEYRGLPAGKFDQLRAKARQSGVYLHVVKNTLARRAVEGTAFECLKPALVGPIVLGFSLEDPGAVGRLIKDFVKENEVMVVKAVAVGGTLYGAKDLDRLATLPTKEQALAMLMGTMKAPIGKFVRTLAEPTAKFVRTVKAVADQKGAA
ncbi:LSU ribosomal protein L10P [Fontimonas thermophila]|uniref:Large ribosomal subunit protein uL10 n=1 Tax=Fontimonas thermophila TaxID=1076937 RepID=A0A1I2JEL9_9GAMM|nr:50S ribosomal protein L10 [Fontimonas thermophila]SFF52538.1 LSU ribosomal protein L10P [Fontimonas thermophila]